MADATPDDMIAAVLAGDAPRVRALLDLSPQLRDAPNMLGARPIHAAHYAGRQGVRELLLSAGVTIDGFLAAELDDVARLAAALDDDPDLPRRYNAGGMTALHGAGYWGAIEAARRLIARGADVTAVSRDDFLQIHPLGSAVATPGVPNPSDDEGRVLALVDLLLDSGADVNARRRDGLTALHTAAYRGQLAVIRRLLDRGADAGLRGYDGKGPHAGRSAEDMAREQGQAAAAQLLARRA
jgi:ankyrin repeat protein